MGPIVAAAMSLRPWATVIPIQSKDSRAMAKADKSPTLRLLALRAA